MPTVFLWNWAAKMLIQSFCLEESTERLLEIPEFRIHPSSSRLSTEFLMMQGEITSDDHIVTIYTGLPGKGKSTEARKTHKEENIFEADKYPDIYINGVYQKDKKEKAHTWCFEQYCEALKEKRTPLAVANTFLRRKHYMPYVISALQHNYAIKIVTVNDFFSCFGGRSKSIHNVPSSVIISMQESSEEYVPLASYHWNQGFTNPNKNKLLICSRENTLVKRAESGKFQLIPFIEDLIYKWLEEDHMIVVVGNQENLELFPDSPEKNKICEEIYEEIDILNKLIPFKSQFLSVNSEGSYALFWEQGLINMIDCYDWKFFHSHFANIMPYSCFSDSLISPFRMPEPGLIQSILCTYKGQFSSVEFIGSSRRDQLAAAGANVPFTHIWNLLV